MPNLICAFDTDSNSTLHWPRTCKCRQCSWDF